MKTTWRWLPLLFLFAFFFDESVARREIFTPEQKNKLENITRVLVEIIAITDQGTIDSGPLAEVVIRRMKELGYTVLTDPTQPHDVVFRVKCEQRKIWEGTSVSGGDADLPDSPSRVWKGPACQLSYVLDGTKMGWRKEIRTEFQDAVKAASEAGAGNPGTFSMAKLKDRLEEYDFPVLVTAEWAQEKRLLTLLDSSAMSEARKVKVISVLGELFVSEAIPHLVAALKDPNVAIANAAAIALGNIGHKESIEALVTALKTGTAELKAAAAKGLGQLGALHGDFSVVPPLIDALNTDDLTVKTEVVLALGKLPDRRAYEPLMTLQRSLRNLRTSDRSSKEGKLWDAVSYSLKQIDTYDQVN
jgi:hypothetical protein